MLLLLTASFSAASAQWTDYLSKAFGSQKPLNTDARSEVVDKHSRVLTSENWRGYLEASTETARAADEDSDEWLFYFTSAVNGTRNATLWDSVYDDTIYALSSTKSPAKLNFAKADCASPEAVDLCNSFYLTQPAKLPVFYHLVSYPNSTIELRRIPLNGTIAAEEQPAYIAHFVTEKKWKDVSPWTNVFNPVDGTLKDASPYLAIALKGYEMMPQWLFMILISFVGRYVSGRVTARSGLNRPAPDAPAAAS